jgi:hypothetical protein
MALDLAVLKARVEWRISELKLLAAWTAVNCGPAEREQLLRDLPPPPVRRNEDDER